MVAFVGLIITIIIVNNNRYSLPIQYTKSDMMLLPLTPYMERDDPSIEKYSGSSVDRKME
jgi:hypothetical protein